MVILKRDLKKLISSLVHFNISKNIIIEKESLNRDKKKLYSVLNTKNSRRGNKYMVLGVCISAPINKKI